MSIVTFDRRASIDEMAAEVDRRGTVIESLEAQVTSLEADRAHWKSRAEDAVVNANARLEEKRQAEARVAELEKANAAWQASFDVYWKSEREALELWQAANPGNELIWPDIKNMTVWLMDRVAELEMALTWRTIDSAPKEGFFLAWTPHFPESACCWKAELFHRANRSDVPPHLSAAGFTHWLPLPAPTAETP